MAEIAKFLEPISAAQPCGINLYYATDFDEIREARRQDDTSPRGLWVRDLKSADHKLVSKLCETALTAKTKDLWIAVWLAEAWIYRDGSAGLLSGIQLLHELLKNFWDGIFPEKDELEIRASPLEWFGSYFEPSKGSSPKLAVYRVPIVKGKFDFSIYQESRKIGYEANVKDSQSRAESRSALIAEGKIAAEVFDKAFEETPKALYKKLDAELKLALAALAELNAFCQEKFDKAAPSFGALRGAIEDVANSVHILLVRKLETDPDREPVEEKKPEEPVPTAQAAQTSQPLPPPVAVNVPEFSGGSIGSADQATSHILAAAQFLRQSDPQSPVSYLLLRAIRWGEVRAAGQINSTELSAPSGNIRVSLRSAAANNNWRQVLDLAETAMSHLTGRGWLDLQRYSVKACDELGYAAAAKAMRSEIKCFLADFPGLPKAILNDDTGAANPETLAWLEKEGLLPVAAA